MTLKFPKAFSAVTFLIAATIAGCATDPAAQHRQHHPESSVSASQGRMGMKDGHMGKGMMMSDAQMTSMCDMHMKIMNAKTPEERKALMAEHLKSMPPEMKQYHLEMMQMMKEHMGSQMPRK